MLILDEATSALDTITEQAAIDSLWQHGHSHTVVMVTRRLSTLQRCHRIIELQGGQIHGIGTYAELQATSPGFRRMAGASQAGESIPVEG
ncbi:hypothetical protein H6G65_02100 [Microcystis elabens FACHB-917]|nr:hypothetical protein [Microcystis elabens FACHB-917]